MKILDTIELSQGIGDTRDPIQTTIDRSHLKISTKIHLMNMILMTKMILNSLELHTTKRSIQLSFGATMEASTEVIMAKNMAIRMVKTCPSHLTNLTEEAKRLIHTRSGSTLSHIFLRRQLRCKARASGTTLSLSVLSGELSFSSFSRDSAFIASINARRANSFWRTSTWVQKSLLSSQPLDKLQPLPFRNQSFNIL